jgi:hypothetical protein
MPFMIFSTFDNTGLPYDPTAIVVGNGTFDLEKYKAYSPIFISTGVAMAYAVAFASFTAVIVHTIRKIFTYPCEALLLITFPQSGTDKILSVASDTVLRTSAIYIQG